MLAIWRPSLLKKTVMTVHNLAFHGQFPEEDGPRVGLPVSDLTRDGPWAWGKLNYLKGGLLAADRITTVSCGYAGEIRHVPYGDGSLRSGPLAEAAVEAGLRMIVISEAREEPSHDAILADLRVGEAAGRPEPTGAGRPLATTSGTTQESIERMRPKSASI